MWSESCLLKATCTRLLEVERRACHRLKRMETADHPLSATFVFLCYCAVSSNGHVLAADNGNNKIRKIYNYSPTAAPSIPPSAAPTVVPSTLQPSAPPTTAGGFQNIMTVAGSGVGASASLVGDGGLPTSAIIFKPSGLSIDTQGTMYVTELSGARVRKIDSLTGFISTFAGTGSAAT
eukprot:gene11690-14877_t